jgi:hypothetical protein
MKKGFIAGIALLFVLAASAQAASFYNDESTWAAAVASTAAVDLSSIAEFDPVDSVAVGSQTLSFSSTLEARQVPGSWTTWAGDRTPRVLYTIDVNSVTGTFSSGYAAFGLVAEPEPLDTYTFTLLLADGTSMTQDILGDSGAAFMGFIAGSPIASWTLSAPVNFAFGEMVYGTEVSGATGVPEPLTLLLLGLGLIGVAGAKRLNH